MYVATKWQLRLAWAVSVVLLAPYVVYLWLAELWARRRSK